MQQRYAGWAICAALVLLAAFMAPSITAWWAHPVHTFLGRREFWWDAEDFAVFYAAGKLVAAGDADLLYTPSAFTPIQNALLPAHQEVTLGYYNPPFFALLLAPLSRLSFDRAFQVWTAINIGLVVLNSWLIWRTAEPLGRAWRCVLIAGFVTLYPLTFGLRLGQYSLILMASWSMAYLLLRAGRDRAAGLALAPLLIKPELLIPVTALMLWKRRLNVLTTLLPVTAVAVVLSVAMIGIQEALRYPGYLSDAAWEGTGNMYGWNGLFSSIDSPGDPGAQTPLALVLAPLTLAAVAWTWRGEAEPRGARFPVLWLLLTIATVLIDLHFYLQDVIIVVPAAVAVVAAQREGTRWIAGSAMVAGWLILAYGSTAAGYDSVNFFTALLVVCMLALCAREVADHIRARTSARPDAGRPADLRRVARSLSRAWVLIPAYAVFIGANLVHDAARAYADNISARAPQNTAAFEEFIFRGYPTVWMQNLLGAELSAMTAAGYYVWQTLFYVPLLLIAYVALVYGRGLFLRLVLLHTVLVLSADVIYAIAPTKPPWMDIGVVRIIELHLQSGVRLDQNPYAALPSLHVAVPFALAFWFARHDETRVRWLGPALFVWSMAIAWSVVYTGEHYAVDVVTGFIWAAIVYFALERLGLTARRRERGAVMVDVDRPPAAVPDSPSTKAA